MFFQKIAAGNKLSFVGNIEVHLKLLGNSIFPFADPSDKHCVASCDTGTYGDSVSNKCEDPFDCKEAKSQMKLNYFGSFKKVIQRFLTGATTLESVSHWLPAWEMGLPSIL